MKKNKLATFLFSLMPGAGEMYYGMYKSGCTIMGLFMGVTALAFFLQSEELLLCLPVIWFYSFCHVHNIKHMDAEALGQERDELFFGLHLDQISLKQKNTYANKIIAVFLIAIGGILAWTNLCDLLEVFPIDYRVAYFLQYRFPQLILGVLIVLAGIWLIRGKRAELEQDEELPDSIFEHDFIPRDTTVTLQEKEGEPIQEYTAEEKLPESEVRP